MLAMVGQNHRTQSPLPNKVLEASRRLLCVSLLYHREVIKHDELNHRVGDDPYHMFVRVKCNPAWQETIPVEKAAESSPLDSPGKKENIIA